MRTEPQPRHRLLPGVLLFAALSAGCSRGGPAVPALRFPQAPIVVVSVDTLRSDRLPIYGHRGVETPALDAFRKEAVLFQRAYTHVPLTLPAHASLFTGLEPGGHGVLDNAGYRLPAGEPTLAELLKGRGYATGGAVSAAVLSGASGIGRGFDLWQDRVEARGEVSMLDFVERPGGETAALLTAWIREQAGRPFFAFLHTYEPHAPYAAPEPHRSRWSDPYDAEVAASDEIVGTFFEELKRLGVWDRAIVVFLSDHGEGLGDHGEQQHGIFLYRESIQVPLLMKLPGNALAGGTVAAPVQLTDLYPTLLGLAGVSNAPARPGTVSLAALAGGAPAPDRRVFAENYSPRIRLGWSELRALVSDRFHYIEAPTPELYDVAADPAQKTNLASTRPPELRAMVVETERRKTPLRAPEAVGAPAPPPPPGAATRLHEAGRSAEAVPLLQEVLRANPRLVDAWEVLANAYERLGRMDDALAALKQTVALSAPGRSNYVADVAALAFRAGRLDEARSHAELARTLGERRADVVLARVALREGKLDEALRVADEGLARGGAPTAGLHVARAEVLGRRERLPEAEREYRAELEAHPTSVEALSGLAIIAAASGDLAEAARRAAAIPRTVPTPDGYVAAIVSLRSFGRPGEAASLLAEAKRAFPGDFRIARLEAGARSGGTR
ncbi:MAG TPA: sulfatase-like hydrolase/transferase [Thermoanaerobaculia bacterium]|nr:sulfatase-like hydrolase/transferase [Thermoanaerobaculia bacterium]